MNQFTAIMNQFKAGQKFTSSLSFRNDNGIIMENVSGTILEVNPDTQMDVYGLLLRVKGIKKPCFVDIDAIEQITVIK